MTGVNWIHSVLKDTEDYKTKSDYLYYRMRNKLAEDYMMDNPDGAVPRAEIDAVLKARSTEFRKAARGAARSLLPNATETKIFCTANVRAIRHFIEMRGNKAADAEIRNLAIAVLKIMQYEAPNLFGDYEVVALDDGTQAANTIYRKV